MDKTFKDILEGFNPDDLRADPLRSGSPVSIWLNGEDKARYDRLQAESKRSKKRFSAVAREAILALMAAAEASKDSRAS